jgi:hypothetical protein
MESMDITQRRAYEILEHCAVYLSQQPCTFDDVAANTEAISIVLAAMDACGIL